MVEETGVLPATVKTKFTRDDASGVRVWLHTSSRVKGDPLRRISDSPRSPLA